MATERVYLRDTSVTKAGLPWFGKSFLKLFYHHARLFLSPGQLANRTSNFAGLNSAYIQRSANTIRKRYLKS